MSEEVMAEKVAAQLRRDILQGKFPPGSPVKERDNARDMGISRTPMREAIRILAKEGLLVLRPARSPIVAQPTFKEVADEIEVLLSLECLSARLACRNATDVDVAKIATLQAEIAEKYSLVDKPELFEMDMAFHSAIAEATHNASLYSTYRAYLERLWRARYLSARQKHNRDQVIAQHTALLNAIIARDETTAQEVITAHLGALAEDIRPVLEEEQSD